MLLKCAQTVYCSYYSACFANCETHEDDLTGGDSTVSQLSCRRGGKYLAQSSSWVWWRTCTIGDPSKIQKSADCLNFVNYFDHNIRTVWREWLVSSEAQCVSCAPFMNQSWSNDTWEQRVAAPSRRQAELLSVEHNVCCKWKGCCVGLSRWFPGYQTAPAHVQPPQVTLPCGCERHRTRRAGASLCCSWPVCSRGEDPPDKQSATSAPRFPVCSLLLRIY